MNRLRDSVLTRINYPSSTIIYAGKISSRTNEQRCFIGNIDKDFFVIADGSGIKPFGDVACLHTGQTALWAYRHIRLRPSYWRVKKDCLKRIFRSVNISLWQKAKVDKFNEGLGSSMMLAISSEYRLWIGNIGSCTAFLSSDKEINKIITPDFDSGNQINKYIGQKRYGMKPAVYSMRFPVGSVLILVNYNVLDSVGEKYLLNFTGEVRDSMIDLNKYIDRLLAQVSRSALSKPMAVYIIKRIPVTAYSNPLPI